MPHLQFVAAASVRVPDPEATGAAVQYWKDARESVFLYAYMAAGAFYFVFPNLATFIYNPATANTKVVSAANASAALVEDTFWRSVVPLTQQLRGLGALHASAIETPAGVVAFCASSGTGKSTLASAFAARGYGLWADDAVVFDATNSESGVFTRALPFRLRLRRESAVFLQVPHLNRDSSSYLRRSFSRGSANSAPLRAIVLLERANEQSRRFFCERMAPADALQAVLAHAYVLSLDELGQRRRLVEQYLPLVAQVPLFQVRFCPDLARLDDLVDGIEREALRPPA